MNTADKVSKKIDVLRNRFESLSEKYPSRREAGFLVEVVEQLESQIKYYKDRLNVERLELSDAVKRRRMLYPTVLAFEKD